MRLILVLLVIVLALLLLFRWAVELGEQIKHAGEQIKHAGEQIKHAGECRLEAAAYVHGGSAQEFSKCGANHVRQH